MNKWKPMRISSEREFGLSGSGAALGEADAELESDLLSGLSRAAPRTLGTIKGRPGLVGVRIGSAEEAGLIQAVHSTGFAPASPAAHPTPRLKGRATELASRTMDVAIALVMLVMLLPGMALIYLALRLTEPGPTLFPHRRIGQDGKEFPCLKFRTMCVDADAKLARILAEDEDMLREWTSRQKLSSDPRVTRLGQFLRNTSLDELPQLFNVIRGDMALVGPRPIVANELARYGRFAREYCAVRPGLTGLWQVTRTRETTYRRRVVSDVYYVRNRSLAYDARILLATVPAVLLGND